MVASAAESLVGAELPIGAESLVGEAAPGVVSVGSDCARAAADKVSEQTNTDVARLRISTTAHLM